MDLSLFLAKVFGLYMLAAGLLILVRRKAIMPAVAEFGESRALLLSIGLLELVAGIALLSAHMVFALDFRGLITFIGVWMIFEGILYAALPMQKLRRLIRIVNKPRWFIVGGILSALLGAWLAAVGFGL